MPSNPSQQALVASLAAYVPPALVRTFVADPQAPLAPTCEHFAAAVLLSDVSGFTALTEKLAAQGPDGAEEMTRLINGYFSRMIDLLTHVGGEVVQFSGDALTAVFVASSNRPSDLGLAVRDAMTAAQQMQAAMQDFAVLSTSAGPIELRMKIAIGAGEVAGLTVGGIRERWQYLIAGDPLHQVAEAEQQGRRGEIALSPTAQGLLSAADPAAIRAIAPAIDPLQINQLALPALRSLIPSAITSRLMADQSEWLAELRHTSILFLGIAELDRSDDDLLQRFQQVMTGIQQIVYRYEGSINKLLVDDKGAIGIILFGAPPLAHHDDPQRAVRCALDLRDLAARLDLKLAIGITSGRVFAGPVGSASRREYTVMGDRVNLAARIMKLAGPGGIRADHPTYTATSKQVDWAVLPPQIVKGKAAAVRVYEPAGWQDQPPRSGVLPLFGREAEVSRLTAALEALESGRSRTLIISGEAGIGKSRLLQELNALMQQHNLVGLSGNGQAIEQQTPYRAWRDVFRGYFGLGAGTGTPEADRSRVLARLRGLAPAFAERAALLNEVLNLGLAESDLTATLDPRLRQESLHSLLLELLTRWAREQPLVLIFDDAQWLDPLSWQLALDCRRSLADLPLLLVIGCQPLPDLPAHHPYRQFIDLADVEHVLLEPLASRYSAQIAAHRLNAQSLPTELSELIERVAAGIPFVAEELALNLRDNGLVQVEAGQVQTRGDLRQVHLPDTVQGMVLSRVDRLQASEQLTIRIAAVIGPSFRVATLRDVYPSGRSEQQLQADLERLQVADLLHPSEQGDGDYHFRQSIIREAVYSTLLRTQRLALHERVAHWYEQRPVEEQAEYYPLLAYHWKGAANSERELHYATLASQRLADEYANQSALSFLDRALELAETPKQREALLWMRLPVWERIGERESQYADLMTLRELAASQGSAESQARLSNAWAAYYRDVSNYPAALIELQSGLELARRSADAAAEAHSLTLWGQISEYQGDFRLAQRHFVAALEIYQRIGFRRGEAENLSRLGNIAYYLDDLSRAREYALAALEKRRSIKDRAGEAGSLANLGLIDMLRGALQEALTWQQEALELAQSIGDRFREAISYASLAQIYQMQANYAAAHKSSEQAIRLFRVLGERRYEADALNALGLVWRDLGRWEQARQCIAAALEIQVRIGDQNLAAYSHLNLGIALSDDEAAEAYHYHRALDLARASGDRFAEAYALSYYAELYRRQNDLHVAIEHYHAAIAIHNEINPAGAAEARAGLAQALLAAGNIADATVEIMRCHTYITEQGIAGIEFPAQVLLDCYDVLLALGEKERGAGCLARAEQLIRERAAAISDPELQASFLQQVPAHRRVLEESLHVQNSKARSIA